MTPVVNLRVGCLDHMHIMTFGCHLMPFIHPLPKTCCLVMPIQAAFARAGFSELTLWPMGVWAAWAVVYYLFVFVLVREWDEAGPGVKRASYVNMTPLRFTWNMAGIAAFAPIKPIPPTYPSLLISLLPLSPGVAGRHQSSPQRLRHHVQAPNQKRVFSS